MPLLTAPRPPKEAPSARSTSELSLRLKVLAARHSSLSSRLQTHAKAIAWLVEEIAELQAWQAPVPKKVPVPIPIPVSVSPEATYLETPSRSWAAPAAVASLAFILWAVWPEMAPSAQGSLPSPSLLAAAPIAQAEPEIEKINSAQASEDDASTDEVLRLVYAWRPEGSKQNIGEILGLEIEMASDHSPWIVEPAGPGRFAATLRPYGDILDNAPLYEFEVDLRSQTVIPSLETAAELRTGDLALAR